ncbi:DUF5053 domain-containing protein [Bacteroidia bacterium]|nr:DUF5053 domain-containing protein [Bacteroidia bacterium]
MSTKEKFEQLKELDINAKSDAERERLTVDFERLATEDPKGFQAAVTASVKQTLADAKELKIKEQLVQISEIVSMSYIAKVYFKKSKSWFSQRINELDVNGKSVKFSQEEIDTLNFAIQDISKKMGTFRIAC